MKRVNVHSYKMTHICSTGHFKSKCIPKLASKGFEPYSAYEDQFMRENKCKVRINIKKLYDWFYFDCAKNMR